MSKEELQVNFRMPASLKGELEALAKRNRRSLTAEIVDRLEKSVGDPGELGVSDRDRLNPAHPSYSLEFDDQKTTKILKERLLSKHDDLPQLQEDKLIAAMVRALRIFEDEKTEPQPNSGPKPRKRFPKA